MWWGAVGTGLVGASAITALVLSPPSGPARLGIIASATVTVLAWWGGLWKRTVESATQPQTLAEEHPVLPSEQCGTFLERLDEEIRRQRDTLAVLLHLEGHTALSESLGPEFSRAMADRIEDALGWEESAAHLHADLFALVLPRIGGASVAHGRLRRLHHDLARPLAVGAVEVRVHPRCGAVLLRGPGGSQLTADVALQRSAEALAHAADDEAHVWEETDAAVTAAPDPVGSVASAMDHV